MSAIEQAGIIMAGYLALGRPGSVFAGLVAGLPLWETLGIVLLIDFLQIPVYGVLIETTSRHVRLPVGVRSWLERRKEKARRILTQGRVLRRLSPFKPWGIVAVAGLPVKGFGVFSACILAFMLGYARIKATVLVMLGSLLGSLVLVLILVYPVRWVRGL